MEENLSIWLLSDCYISVWFHYIYLIHWAWFYFDHDKMLKSAYDFVLLTYAFWVLSLSRKITVFLCVRCRKETQIILKFMVSFYSVYPYWREFADLSREALKVSFHNTMLLDFSSLLYNFLQIWQNRPSWLCHPLFPHLSEPDAESQDISDLFSEFFPWLPASPSCFTAVSASLISDSIFTYNSFQTSL